MGCGERVLRACVQKDRRRKRGRKFGYSSSDSGNVVQKRSKTMETTFRDKALRVRVEGAKSRSKRAVLDVGRNNAVHVLSAGQRAKLMMVDSCAHAFLQFTYYVKNITPLPEAAWPSC